MKKSVIFSSLFSVLFLFILTDTGVSAEPIVLNYSSGYADSQSLTLSDIWWAKEVEKRTKGKVKIQFYWSQGLATIPESLEAVSTGLADIAYMALGYFGGQLPLATSSSLFYLSDKPDAVSKALMEMYRTVPAFREEFEKKNNVIPLMFAGTTPVIFGSRNPWRLLDDFRGKKVRTFPGMEKPLSKLGAIPVAISFGELFVSLERGVVDAYTGTMWDLAAPARLYEKAPYILDLGVGTFASGATLINRDTWKKLPDDVKTVMKEVAKEAMTKQAGLIMDADKRAYELYKKAGVKTILFSDKSKAKLKNLVVPQQWNEWVADMERKGLPGKKFLTAYKAALAKCTSQSKYVSPFVRFPDLVLK